MTIDQIKAFQKLNDLCKYLSYELQEICLRVIEDSRFQGGFGSSGYHHAYEGGLLIHTAEVAFYADGLSYHDEIPIAAAILHDYCKIWEYEKQGDKIVKTDYARKIGHVVGGYSWFVTNGQKIRSDIHLEISHCLLSHHGRLEWRSPVEPQTKWAHILHAADMISVQEAHAKEKANESRN